MAGRSLGERALEALMREGLVALAPRARDVLVAQSLDAEHVALLDDPSLDDEELGASNAELLERLDGVDEVFGTDADLARVVREADSAE